MKETAKFNQELLAKLVDAINLVIGFFKAQHFNLHTTGLAGHKAIADAKDRMTSSGAVAVIGPHPRLSCSHTEPFIDLQAANHKRAIKTIGDMV